MVHRVLHLKFVLFCSFFTALSKSHDYIIMSENLQFTVGGLTLRGHFKTRKYWVPYSGERLNCEIEINGAISAKKEQQSVGSVQTEWSKCFRKWINAGGKLEAIVSGLHKVHRNKGEEVPVIYLFSGNRTPLLINIKKSIREGLFIFFSVLRNTTIVDVIYRHFFSYGCRF